MKADETIDICVITYNRLEYLKNCVWSILASTKIKYRLTVFDDCSTDGTAEWLEEMKQNGKIDNYIINEINSGSPTTINNAVTNTTSEIVAIISDDIWVHRGWDINAFNIYNKFDDCGMVSFWNYPTDHRHKVIDNMAYKIQEIGVAAMLLSRTLFNAVGGYSLPGDLKMGYFSRIFCKSAKDARVHRKFQYLAHPFDAEQMDRNNPRDSHLPKPKLNQEYLYRYYNKSRGAEKTRHKNFNKK